MTELTIVRDRIHVNGQPVHAGTPAEGLLTNARLVQATFDDLNPETRKLWDWPDGTPWDADLNAARFCDALADYAGHGLAGITVNLQGGSPQGYSKHQPWINSAFTPDGELRPAYMERMRRVLTTADQLGMVVILGLFYFGQEPKMNGDAAVMRAVDGVSEWLADLKPANVIVEIANECDIAGFSDYASALIKPPRAHELIERVRRRTGLPTSTSFRGGALPTGNVLDVADVMLIHGNGVNDPADLGKLIDQTRAQSGYRGQPVIVNEDDHFDYSDAGHFMTAIKHGAGWGYFDYRMMGEPWEAGFQSVPTDWRISHARKTGFFSALKSLTGS